MNDVGGTGGGTGLRAVKASRSSDANFEYDDSEWDVGIGNLIIDLDADIEKNNEASRTVGGGGQSNSANSSVNAHNSNTSSSSSCSSTNSAPLSSPMHIPQSPVSSGSNSGSSSSGVKGGKTSSVSKTSSTATALTNVTDVSVSSMEHSAVVDKGLKMKIKRTKTGTKSGADAKHEIVKSDLLASASSTPGSNNSGSGSASGTATPSSKAAGDVKNVTHPSHKDKEKVKEMIVDGESNMASSTNNSNTNTSSVVSNTKADKNGAEVSAIKNKASNSKRASTHKKIKGGITSTIGAVSLHCKKETNSHDIKSSSTNKEKEFNFTTVNLNVPTIIPNVGSSAFVKATPLKVPGSISTSTSGASSTYSTNASHGNVTTIVAAWPSTALAKSSEKVHQPSSVTTSTSAEKPAGTNSPTTKKSRVCIPSEKQSTEESHSNSSSLTSLSPFRTSTSLSNSSTNDLPLNASINLHASQAGNGSTNPVAGSKTARTIRLSGSQDVCIGTSVATVTEPDCLGPCEPGTAVTLEGIVWHETESGLLVVNVTWRGKTYVGTLLDCTKNDWASPRFCDSPTSDLEMRTPKNRGKRGRAQTSTPVNDTTNQDNRLNNTKLRNGAKGRRGSSGFVTPVSPMKSDSWPKRKTRGSETENPEEIKGAKRPKAGKDGDRKDRQSNSPAPDLERSGPYSPQLIECPEPNCFKKYKHINGLRYHQSHAHSNNFAAEDSDSNMSTASTNMTTTSEIDKPVDSIPMDTGNDTLDTAKTLEGGSALVDDCARAASQANSALDKDTTSEKDLSSNKESSLDAADVTNISTGRFTSAKIGKSGEKEIAECKTSTKDGSGSTTPRPPILTVPVPYMSLQNRPMAHGHVVNVPRMDTSHRDSDLIKNSGGGNGGGASAIMSKGPPWQPHAHGMSQNHGISSSDKRDKDANAIGGKKVKHKKKSKDRDRERERERERERDGKKSTSKSEKEGTKMTTVSASAEGVRSRSDSLAFSGSTCGPDSIGGRNTEEVRNRHMVEESHSDGLQGNAGDNRDDPQSPAYSDISDANDSGTESDIRTGKENCKNLGIPTELKKDGSGSVGSSGGGHHMSAFYPSFYSPYLDTANSPNSSNSNPKTDRSNSNEEPVGDKSKSRKPTSSHHMGQTPSGASGSSDEGRRSPKYDYHSKYMPHQPHYFPYPYSNYHFDQSSYTSLMPEGSFGPGGHGRVLQGMDEKEPSDSSKSKSLGLAQGDKEDGVSMLITVKQEPLDREDRRPKESRLIPPPTIGSPENKDIKSEFPSETSSDSKRLFPSVTCSKHSRDGKRSDRDDRHEPRPKESDAKCDRDSIKDNIVRMSLLQEKSKEDSEKDPKEREKNEGAKPTMETQGPPPPPTAGSYAYIPQSYLQSTPFGLPFDPGHPLYRQVLVPGPYAGSPYMHHSSIPRYPPNPGSTPIPEDLSRPSGSAPGSAKALDLLQHHAAQYYSAHKIHELQERALKSPTPQGGPRERDSNASQPPPSSPGGLSVGSSAASSHGGSGRSSVGSTSSGGPLSKPTELTKESKPIIMPGGPNESSRSPPTQHHVHSHTHHHTHVGIGYPIIPTVPVPPQYSPHYGVLTTPSSATGSVIPPYAPPKPN